MEQEKDKKYYIDRPVISKDEILEKAVDDCLDKMYRASYPSITLDEYKKQHEGMTEEEKDKSQLFNSHYLPSKVYDAIKDDFVEAYELKSQLPTIIDILKDYFKEPVVDKWIEDKDDNDLGHRGYERPEPMDEETFKTVEKYMDMANGFFKWNRDVDTFYFSVANYSPCSNRETVEKWWHEHGDPDFKLPDDSYWVDGWDDEIEDPTELEALRGYQDGRKEPDDFKEVATKLVETETNYLDNLHEKVEFNYVDADYVEFDTQAVGDAAKSLTDAFKKVGGFDDDDDEGFHYFLSAPQGDL